MSTGIDGANINHLRMDVAHWWVCGLGMGLDIGVGVRCRTPLGRGRERFKKKYSSCWGFLSLNGT